MTDQTSEYLAFASEWDELVDCELIPCGIYKGCNLDHQIELNWEQRAEMFVEAQQRELDRLESMRFDVPTNCLPKWANSHEDKID
jgi:hypothetical protein